MKKIVKLIISIIFFILSGILLFNINKLNLLPLKYIILIGVILLIVNIIACIFLIIKNKWLKIISIVIYLAILIISIVGIHYLNITNKFLNEAFNNAEETFKTTYYVASIDDVSIDELNNKDIYYYEAMEDKENVLNKLKEKISANFISSSDVSELLKMNNIILEKATYDFLYEQKDKVDFNYKIIYEFTTEVKLTNEEVGENEEVDEYASLQEAETYNIFIGGYDFTNTYMDFNMLVTINKTNNEILLTSIPRDYYITDPVVGRKDKLSDMGHRGIERNMAAVSKLFGVKIDYYIRVNTRSLVALVDAVGGITYCSDQEYTTTHAMILDSYNDSKGEKLHVVKGCQYVNGIKALTIARERLAFKTGDNQRQKNCQQIMKSILNKMKSASMISNYANVLNAVNGFYSTTIPKELITSSVQELLSSDFKISTQSVTGYGGSDYIFFSSTKDYVMYPHTSSVETAKAKIQRMRYV